MDRSEEQVFTVPVSRDISGQLKFPQIIVCFALSLWRASSENCSIPVWFRLIDEACRKSLSTGYSCFGAVLWSITFRCQCQGPVGQTLNLMLLFSQDSHPQATSGFMYLMEDSRSALLLLHYDSSRSLQILLFVEDQMQMNVNCSL